MSNNNPTDPKLAQLDALMPQMPQEIVECVQKHGFHKLAAAVYGVPEINERTVALDIGTKLATQKLEWSEIVSGLKALQTLRS